jgi:putative transposase
MDLNMVRAGVVDHPCDWPHGGFAELVSERKRYRCVNEAALGELLETKSQEGLRQLRHQWVGETLAQGAGQRDIRWTQSLAVGRQTFVDDVQTALIQKGQKRSVLETAGGFILREAESDYAIISPPKSTL